MAKVTQFTIALEHRPGAAAEVVEALANAKVNIIALVGSAHDQQGRVQLVAESAAKAKKALQGAGITFTARTVEQVELANKPGTLAAHLKKLAAKGVNLESIYASSSPGAKKGSIIIGAETAAAAKPVQTAGAA